MSSCFRQPEADDHRLQLPRAAPQHFHPGFAVAFASQEPSQPADPADRFPQRRRLRRRRLPGPQLTPQHLPFLRAHGRLARRRRLLTRPVGEMQQPRRHHRVQRQGAPQPRRRLPLQFLQPAAALEREVITLDPPAVGVPAAPRPRSSRRAASSAAARWAPAIPAVHSNGQFGAAPPSRPVSSDGGNDVERLLRVVQDHRDQQQRHRPPQDEGQAQSVRPLVAQHQPQADEP